MKLEPGEVLCDNCQGSGVIRKTEKIKKDFIIKKDFCPKCLGDGKLDWIENITGKEPKNNHIDEELKIWFPVGYNCYKEEDDDKLIKPSFIDIKNLINPNYKKQLERKNRFKGGRF